MIISSLFCNNNPCYTQDREPKRPDNVIDVETGIVFAQLAGNSAASTHHDMFELSLSKALQGKYDLSFKAITYFLD